MHIINSFHSKHFESFQGRTSRGLGMWTLKWMPGRPMPFVTGCVRRTPEMYGIRNFSAQELTFDLPNHRME